ncbi:hypothetical protein GQ607_008745, partial [Colletotrichum asianum]
AFWLRSSVVSVLFSLISERPPRRSIVIILIFDLSGEWPLRLAVCPHAHRVPGISLPPGDANPSRLSLLCLVPPRPVKKVSSASPRTW